MGYTIENCPCCQSFDCSGDCGGTCVGSFPDTETTITSVTPCADCSKADPEPEDKTTTKFAVVSDPSGCEIDNYSALGSIHLNGYVYDVESFWNDMVSCWVCRIVCANSTGTGNNVVFEGCKDGSSPIGTYSNNGNGCSSTPGSVTIEEDV